MQSPQTLVQPSSAPRAASTRLEPPVLGRYRLLERLGSGGFGVVWRARDELLHREVAVKRIVLEPGTDGARATREALAGARLAHPAIVALYEACAEDDAFYLISELVHGQTLAKLIASGSLRDEQVLEIGAALADALAHAHARGVIHRDVKPQNVLVPDRPSGDSLPGRMVGVAKLTDFGGARLAGEDVLTRTGDVLGTLAYMAPEQSDGHEAAESADLYSLALVLYEALSGTNPVRGATPAETARRIGRPVAPLRRARRDLPGQLTSALDRALSPSPSDRGVVQELGRKLERATGELQAPARRSRGHRGDPLAQLQLQRARPIPERELAHRPVRAPALHPGLDPEPAPMSRARRTPAPLAEPQPAQGASLPRAVWLGCGLAVAVWQAATGRAGVALLLVAAIAPLVALPRRVGAGWTSCALAPALGLVGLAGAFPAVAGQAGRWSQRAGLAALGYWWLVLAEPLSGRRLWLGQPLGVPARAAWEGSLTSSGAHVVGPLFSLAVLLGAALWAAGAIVLPWIVRGRRAVLDVVAATVWASVLATTAPRLGGGLSTQASPRGLVLGAVLGGAIAVGARALRGPV